MRCTVDQSEYKNVVDIVLPNTSDENQESVDDVDEFTTDMDYLHCVFSCDF